MRARRWAAPPHAFPLVRRGHFRSLCDNGRAMAIELRCFTYIDILQPQTASFLATVSRGYMPLERMAAV